MAPRQSRIVAWFRNLRLGSLSALAGVALGALGLLSALSIFISDGAQVSTSGQYDDLRRVNQTLDENIRALQEELAAYEHRTRRLASVVQESDQRVTEIAAEVVSPPGTQQSALLVRNLADLEGQVRELASQVEDLATQLGRTSSGLDRIEASILQDPQRALELPLIRRDLDALGKRLDDGLMAARAENGRAYDLMKWLMGLMALVSLGLMGTALGNVFKREAHREKVPNSATAASSPEASR